MGSYVVVFDGLFNAGHVAGDALASRAVFGVMGVFCDCAFEAGWVICVVAGEAERVAFFLKVGFVATAVNVVAVEAP